MIGQNLASAMQAAIYHLSLISDPSVVPTDGVKGSMGLGVGPTIGGRAWLKQDDGLTTNWLEISTGGGGGGQIPVLNADPMAPAFGEQWFLSVPPVPFTGFGITVPAMSPFMPPNMMPVVIQVNSVAPATKAFFETAGPGSQKRITFVSNPMLPANSITVIGNAPGQGLVVQFGANTTLGTLKAGLENWGNLNIGGALVMTVQPGDLASQLTIPNLPLDLADTGGVAEQMILKIQGVSKVFTTTML